MRTLTLDIGNSRVKYALAEGLSLARPRVAEPGGDLEAALRAAWRTFPAPDRVAVASVRGAEALAAVAAAAHGLGWPAPRAIGVTQDLDGLHVAYAEPRTLGVDRWAAMLAARRRVAGGVVVADAGTALTLDLIDVDGAHRGGLIAPGLATMRASLRQGAHRLADSADTRGPPACPATDTTTAIAAGTHLGLADMVDGLAARLAATAAEPPVLLLTGGDADALAPYLARPWRIEEGLVLEGVAVAAEAGAWA